MGWFKKDSRLQSKESEPTPKRVEIPTANQEREKFLLSYQHALEILEAREDGVNLDDYDMRFQPETHKKLDELKRDRELRAAVSAYRDATRERRVA